jgi:hypothetical protein
MAGKRKWAPKGGKKAKIREEWRRQAMVHDMDHVIHGSRLNDQGVVELRPPDIESRFSWD